MAGLASTASDVDVTVDQPRNDLPAFEVGDLDPDRRGEIGPVGSDPGDPVCGDEYMPVALRLRSVQVRVEQEMEHGQEVTVRWCRT